MGDTNTIARSMHDLGLAAWFGGSLMGAIGLNGAAGEVDDPGQRARVANTGWARWTPVNMVAIGAHLIGGTVIAASNKGRVAGQEGVAGATVLKTVLTAAALAVTGYSRWLGQKIMNEGDVPVEGATEPSAFTPPDAEQAQRRLRLLQWTIPALTGAVLILNSLMGEQQRPTEVASGIAQRAGRVLPWRSAA